MMKLSSHLQDVHENAECIYTKAQVDAALDELAHAMSMKLHSSNPVFLCVLVGGMVPLGNLLPRLDFQLELNYLHVSSYGLANTQGQLNWQSEPTAELSGRTVVIFDDILDTGVTLQVAIDYCKAKGAKEVYTAVLLDKRRPRKPGGVAEADFKALTIEDKFVYGYGLDYSEYLRNAPGIYAVTEQLT